MRHLRAVLAIAILSVVVGAVAHGQPRAEHGLHYTEPAQVWDEALPLGNGLLGGLVWGDGKPLRISLDRTDLWDLRPVPEFHTEEYSYATMRQWVKAGRIGDLHRLYDQPYGHPGPTKIPAGRIELTLAGDSAFEDTSLDLAQAVARMRFADGGAARVFVHATEPVGMIHIRAAVPRDIQLLAPPFAARIEEEAAAGKISAGDLASLRYEAPRQVSGENWTGYRQKGWGDFSFAVALAWRRSGQDWTAAWSIVTSNDSDRPLEAARRNCERALAGGFDKALSAHRRWWDSFWSASSVRVPNAIVERQWYLETYKFGAATRADTPPITLQGPWTADNRKIPPWKGDYHHDLNTELCYWPAYAGNHLDGAAGFVTWLWDTKANARAWTKRFFGLPGLNVPMTADLEQHQIGGWHQYTHSATTGAWLAHHFYLHWRYSMDRDFLRDRAYPWLRDVCVFLEAVTEKGPDGKRTLPLSSSPEINDNRLEAWFPSITNYDLALIRWTFATTADLAEELGKGDDARHWRSVLAEMPEWAVDPQSRKLLVAKDHPLPASHRHFSHLMAIHPLGLIRWENGPRDRAIIRASLADLDEKGTAWWTGYSFSWLANLAARARDGAKAEEALELFSTAFCLRNSFHCNGDQSGRGHSNFRYRPFTLEGNFAAAAGLQEMLLQSYSGTVRAFPAIPADWQDVSFTTLRAEGAFLVSATREDGLVRAVEVTAEKGGLLRLENPFAAAAFDVSGARRSDVTKQDGELVVTMSPGQTVRFMRE
ncbi:MAG: glycoside hydrolase N-terminal domain-containing protein [Sedimentisphaerales bacterium]|nr:glycoside hydrolase N-terminal domain-containing protein [Sedimentisphaerales bacterium]